MSKEYLNPSPLEGANRYQPKQIIEEALSYINDDDTVHLYDHEDETWFTTQIGESVDLENTPPDTYAARLNSVSHGILASISHIRTGFSQRETNLRNLAAYLGPYRHDPYFLDHAASLLEVSEDGLSTKGPHLPQESPWRWVPRSRQK